LHRGICQRCLPLGAAKPTKQTIFANELTKDTVVATSDCSDDAICPDEAIENISVAAGERSNDTARTDKTIYDVYVAIGHCPNDAICTDEAIENISVAASDSSNDTARTDEAIYDICIAIGQGAEEAIVTDESIENTSIPGGQSTCANEASNDLGEAGHDAKQAATSEQVACYVADSLYRALGWRVAGHNIDTQLSRIGKG